MELSLDLEDPADGLWDAYCDGARLKDDQQWYLHDHGTWAETQITSSDLKGEWARFYDIEIMICPNTAFYWVSQLLPWYPMTVVDDNPYFGALFEQNQSDAWYTTPSSWVDEDALSEIGTWAQGPWAGYPQAYAIADGFRGEFPGQWVPYIYEDDEVIERDLREYGFIREGHHGSAATGFDGSDFSLWVSHGNDDYDHLFVNTLQDSHSFWEAEARWGKTDLEWAYIFACRFTGWDTVEKKYHDYAAMAELHVLCGFCTNAGIPNPPRDGQMGQDWALHLKGQISGVKRTVLQAWELTALEHQLDPNKWTRSLFTPTTVYDHLPGYGSYAITDPTGWMMGGATYYHDAPGG